MEDKDEKKQEQIDNEDLSKRDKEIADAKKEMDDLIDSMKEELGIDKNVKVIQIRLPKPSVLDFIKSLILLFIINSLLIVGSTGFITYFMYESIIDLLLFSLYFSLIERVASYIILLAFPSLIIKTMGAITLLPSVISLAVSLIFPIFVSIENIGLAIIVMVIITILRTYLKTFLQNKIFINKIKNKRTNKHAR